jgi:beta-N-acetylhexosaminidase
VLTDLLRGELRYDGLVITDALDMKALAQGPAQVVDVIAAVNAGADLLLGTVDAEAAVRIDTGLAQAAARGLIDAASVAASLERLRKLRAWVAGFREPAPTVVGCAEHRSLARELAERSITLVRNDEALLPLRLGADARVAVVTVRPTDLTPADTSSYVRAGLADAIRRRHPRTDEFEVDGQPRASDIASLRNRVRGHKLLVIGTINASQRPAQADLVKELLGTGVPAVTVALRTPWDLTAYPDSRTHVCAYGILDPTTEATAAALFGEAPFRGHLPVTLGDLHPLGHGITE